MQSFNIRFDGISDLSSFFELFGNYGIMIFKKFISVITSGKEFNEKFANLAMDVMAMVPGDISIPSFDSYSV